MRAHKTLESCVDRHIMCMFARGLSGVYNNLPTTIYFRTGIRLRCNESVFCSLQLLILPTNFAVSFSFSLSFMFPRFGIRGFVTR